MLIKYYGYHFPQNLHIIEDITNVMVHASLESSSPDLIPAGPKVDHENPVNHYLYDTIHELFGAGKSGGTDEPGNSNTKFVQFIDFTRNGIRCRLPVYGRAYICNDEGKTIEKVDPKNC